MNWSEFATSKVFRKTMGFVYGWGASIVLLGALFKINHYPGASLMLIVGLSVEAIIFFLSAFEPPHEEVDWSLVYPELAGVENEVIEEDKKSVVSSKKSALEKFDALIENAEITPELFEKLGHGLRNLNTTTEKLHDVSDVTVATNEYVASFEKASHKVNEFADVYGKSASQLNQSADQLARTYIDSSDMVGATGKALSESYAKMTEAINQEYASTTQNGKTYVQQLEVMTKNLTALNNVYELQLQGTNEQFEASKKLYSGLDEIMANLKDSANDTKRYRDEIGRLSQNLAAMNTIYGNMLAAMNVKVQD